MTHTVAVIGTGIFATQKHLPAIAKNKDLEITGCFNRTSAKAEAFAKEAEKAGAKSLTIYSSIDELLADPNVDSVDALLPVDQNLSIVKKAIAAGKPISFEKPIAASLEDGAEIVKLAESTPVPVLVLENWCYHHGVKRLKEELPKIGKVTHFTFQASGPFRLSQYHGTAWRQHPKHIGGFLSDAGVHDLGLLTEVLGPIASISARTTQVREASGTVDTLSSLFSMEDNGVFGTYTQSRYSGPCESVLNLQIFGTDGSLVYDRPSPAGGKLTVYTKSDAGESTHTTEQLPEDELNGVVDEFINWAEVLDKKDKSLIVATPRKAFHHYAAIAAAVKSGELKGQPVEVQKLK